MIYFVDIDYMHGDDIDYMSINSLQNILRIFVKYAFYLHFINFIEHCLFQSKAGEMI